MSCHWRYCCCSVSFFLFFFFFFFNDTATTEIYTLSLHDALPISADHRPGGADQSGALEPVQRRVDGAGGQVERAAAARPDGLDDGVAVQWAALEHGQQQPVEVPFEG